MRGRKKFFMGECCNLGARLQPSKWSDDQRGKCITRSLFANHLGTRGVSHNNTNDL